MMPGWLGREPRHCLQIGKTWHTLYSRSAINKHRAFEEIGPWLLISANVDQCPSAEVGKNTVLRFSGSAFWGVFVQFLFFKGSFCKQVCGGWAGVL